MKVLFFGGVIFMAGFILHLLIWRIRLPKSQTKALLLIFFLTLTVGQAILLFNAAGLNFFEYLHIWFLVFALAIVYIQVYSGIEADSPSLVMAMAIASKKEQGLQEDELFAQMGDDLLVKPRVEDLLEAEMVVFEQGKFKITKSGRAFVAIFILFRRLLKLPKGG